MKSFLRGRLCIKFGNHCLRVRKQVGSLYSAQRALTRTVYLYTMYAMYKTGSKVDIAVSVQLGVFLLQLSQIRH